MELAWSPYGIRMESASDQGGIDGQIAPKTHANRGVSTQNRGGKIRLAKRTALGSWDWHGPARTCRKAHWE